MKIYCENESCKNFGQSKILDMTVFGYRTEDERKEMMKCPECGQLMKPKREAPNTLYFSTFNSKTSEEKKAILKKRSDYHNKTSKELRSRREALDRGDLSC